MPALLNARISSAHTHNLLTRDSTSSSTPTSALIPILFGILVPIFLLSLCCCAASGSSKKKTEQERKQKELEDMIARSVRLHEEIIRAERESESGGGGGAGDVREREAGESGLSDSVVARIVRDVQREMGRVDGITGGVGADGNGSGSRNGRRVLVRRRSESVVVIDGAGVTGEVRDGDRSVIQEPPPAYKPRG